MKEFSIGIRAGHFLSMKGGLGEVKEDVFIGLKGAQIAEVVAYKAEHQKLCARMVDA